MPPTSAQKQVLGEAFGLAPGLNRGTTLDFGVGDFDGDGKTDLFLARADSDALLLGIGVGRFDELIGALPGNTGESHAVAIGDVDGDGDLDAVLAKVGANALLLNDGSAHFVDASGSLPTNTTSSRDVHLSDIDQDGNLDLIVANYGVNQLYLGTGSGGFAAAPAALGLDSDYSNATLLIDIDLDGDLDIIFANGTLGSSAGNQLLRNDGAVQFADLPGVLPFAQTPTYALAAGDVDGDGGSVDLLLGTRLFLKQGAVFVDATWQAPQPYANINSIALGDIKGDGDIEGDGDIDVIFAGEQPRIWRNLMTQLVRRGPARLAKPFTLELHGEPLGQCMVAVAPAVRPPTMTPFGLLHLNPASLGILGSYPFDANGLALLTIPTPPGPGALGLTMYAQALCFPSQRLTSWESATISDW